MHTANNDQLHCKQRVSKVRTALVALATTNNRECEGLCTVYFTDHALALLCDVNCMVVTSAAGSEEGAVDLPGAEARSKAPDVLKGRFSAVGIGGMGMNERVAHDHISRP